MPKQYQYRGLASQSTVRLIKLEELRVGGRIACKIRYTEQSIAKYYALSYVWGDPATTREIFIFDDNAHEWTSFPVHENLWQFLNNFWERRIFDRWLWTDRICLNQKDETEKSEQIPRMADIYHNAWRVVAWLGLVSAIERENLLPIVNVYRTPDSQLETNWYPKFSEESAVAAGKVIFEAEYWKRVWVVQEVASAKKLVFFIGNMRLTFEKVLALWYLSGRATDHEREWHAVHNLSLLISNNLASRTEDGPAPKFALWELLSTVTIKQFKSQQPHDRVYGILGLAANLSDGTSPRAHIGIDYGKPPADVILDAILESHPPWNSYKEYSTAVHLLLIRPDNTTIWEPVFTFLTRYSESSRTSQRHRELAKLVLSVSDALYFLASFQDSPPGNWSTRRAFGELTSRLKYDFSLERTAQHNAVILGVALSLVIYNETTKNQMFADWKSCRHARLVARSPWRCATHQLPIHAKDKTPFPYMSQPETGDNSETQTAQYQFKKRKEAAQRREYHGSIGLRWTLGPKTSFEKICGGFKHLQGSGSCDGSFVSCEFPEANFRLRVSTYEHSRDNWRTKWLDLSFLPPDLH